MVKAKNQLDLQQNDINSTFVVLWLTVEYKFSILKTNLKLNKMKNEEIKRGILETYSSIISVLKNMPGMKMEEVFSGTTVKELQDEKEFLERLFKEANDF
jgi:hypothetical protein